MGNNRVKLAAPWTTFFREIESLFEEDPEVRVEYDEGRPAVKVYVDNDDKAVALDKLLPHEKSFGNVSLAVEVIPANGTGASRILTFQKAFEGNPAVSFTKTVEGVFANPISYVVFKNKVVQFFNDNLGDVRGLTSTLYQDIALDVFGDQPGICFCTDIDPDGGNVGMPLGEWP